MVGNVLDVSFPEWGRSLRTSETFKSADALVARRAVVPAAAHVPWELLFLPSVLRRFQARHKHHAVGAVHFSTRF